MHHYSPIYNLLHQEMRACANRLLEMSQDKGLCSEENVESIMGKLLELHQFASKVCDDEHYNPLAELKKYLETTMLRYKDEQNQVQSMRLSEVISLLGTPNDLDFKPSITQSLTRFFLHHFREESKPGRPLFRKLAEIKKL